MLLSITRTFIDSLNSSLWIMHERSNLIGEFSCECLNQQTSSGTATLNESKFEFLRRVEFLGKPTWEIRDSRKSAIGEIQIPLWIFSKPKVQFFDQAAYEWKMKRSVCKYLIASYCKINFKGSLINAVDEIVFKTIYNDKPIRGVSYFKYPLIGTIHVTNSLRLFPVFAGLCLIEELLAQFSRN